MSLFWIGLIVGMCLGTWFGIGLMCWMNMSAAKNRERNSAEDND